MSSGSHPVIVGVTRGQSPSPQAHTLTNSLHGTQKTRLGNQLFVLAGGVKNGAHPPVCPHVASCICPETLLFSTLGHPDFIFWVNICVNIYVIYVTKCATREKHVTHFLCVTYVFTSVIHVYYCYMHFKTLYVEYTPVKIYIIHMFVLLLL